MLGVNIACPLKDVSTKLFFAYFSMFSFSDRKPAIYIYIYIKKRKKRKKKKDTEKMSIVCCRPLDCLVILPFGDDVVS
jgi:hypothetical protein